ncbi:hypothetical protein QBC40DRAFT_282537 [Triangularia verruculosa]|uniref:Uncharacterized protein n=1 Tax=Triangularia verruculosa TaxID=2587418 RepID=A0AAN7AS41_9PEZI|nr:hypothetical protein QBC40DRAFT_282537 [Triangularia verruculosa]
MSGFPKLIPAFTARVAIEPPTSIAPNLVHVPFIPSAGSIVSESSYPIQVNAPILHGADYITTSPDAKTVKLEVQSIAKDSATGARIRFNYTGTVALLGAAGKVLKGDPSAATTGFGEAFIHPVFQTGGVPELAELANKTYVGSGRFIIEEGKPVIVEYKISEVVA